MLLALINWVENGTSPDYVVGASYEREDEDEDVRTKVGDDRRFGYGTYPGSRDKTCPGPPGFIRYPG